MNIPDEMNIKFSTFLSPLDVINYQSSCKHLKKIINLNLLHRASLTKVRNLHERGAYDSGDKVREWVELSPFLFLSYIHTVKLSFKYKDQGWGNRKGYVYIKEIGNNQDTFIAKSPLAQHSETECELSFKPKKGLSYFLFYKVGGGGGHELFVNDIKLQSYVYCAAAPLVNKLPKLFDNFFLDMIECNLEIIPGLSDIGQHGRLISLFKSIGLDLNNKIHIEHIKIMLCELQMCRK